MSIKPIEILIKARDEASSVFGSLQAKVAAVGAAIASYFGFTAFAGAVKGAGELEAKLSEVKAVSNATAEEMAALRQAAENAGRTTQFSATQSADALGQIARAGVSAKDAITTLPAVLNLAQAGGIDLGRASEFLTKVISGMGLQFSEAGRAADVLAMGANASNTSVTGLAEAMSYAAPVAKSVGLSLEGTVAIIGKFSDAGIDASRAGTALNEVLSQFSDPSSKFRQELALAGITTRDFEKAIHQLAAAGPAGEKAILAVGLNAGPSLRALLNQGMGALDDLKAKLTEASGSAAATAAVMADNLPGAVRQLETAWDSVKNTLATPVLPVLRDGVKQLTEALRGAVTDGTIGRFGTALADGFKNALQWAREFLSKVDFAAMAAQVRQAASQVGEALSSIAVAASTASSAVTTAYGVMTAGVGVVMAAVFKIAEAFSGVASNIQSGIALILTGLSKITFGDVSKRFREAAEDMRISANATMAVSQAYADKASAAFDAAAKGADLARKGFSELSDGTAEAARSSDAGARAFEGVATALKGVGAAAADAGTKTAVSAEALKAKAEEARVKVAELRAEYERLVQAGNLQGAAQKLVELNKALEGTKTDAASASEKLKDVQEAFTRLGVTSAADLAKTRDAFRRDYETIRDSGLATTRDIQNAFVAYAEKAIAANGGVATEALKSEAAMRQVSITTDESGKVIVKAMNEAAGATGNVGGAAASAADQMRGLAAAAEAAGRAAAALGTRTAGKIDGSGIDAFSKSVGKTDTMMSVDDASYVFQLWAKFQAGQISADDLKGAQNALRVAQDNARLGGPGSVSFEGKADDQMWIGRLQQIVDAADAASNKDNSSSAGATRKNSAPSPAPAPAALSVPAQVAGTADLTQLIAQLRALTDALSASGRTVNLNLSLNGVSYGSVPTNEAGEQALSAFLSSLGRSSQRAA